MQGENSPQFASAAPAQLAIDSEGYYFLDRDPTYVHYVLEFLRNGGRLPANMPHPSDPEYARIREEFDYFLLSDVAFGPARKSIVAEFGAGRCRVEDLVSTYADGKYRQKVGSVLRMPARACVRKRVVSVRA